MTSRLLSQIFNQNSASIYETLLERDGAASSDSDIDDLEERAGMLPTTRPALSDSSIPSNESAYELHHASPGPSNTQSEPSEQRLPFASTAPRPRGSRYTSGRYRDEDDNTEVPESLLFEDNKPPDKDKGTRAPLRRGASGILGAVAGRNTDGAGPSTANTHHLHEQWNAATEHYQRPEAQERIKLQNKARLGLIDPKERALWKWANVENLDNFLGDVYDYYTGKGIYNILLARVLNLLTIAFVVAFSTFLSLCINYHEIHPGKKLSDIMEKQCMSRMSGSTTFLLWSISFYWMILFTQGVLDLRRLWDLRNFYIYLLEIPDTDMQSISWQEVVARLMALRDANPNTSTAIRRRNYSNQSKQRMDAHDIANRLMRKENYLIALFNKEILDLTVPLPFLRQRGSMLTRTLEWNLSLCILDFVFNEQGQLRTLFLKDTHRRMLSEGLKRRFLFAGMMNIVFAPFIATYFLLVFLLRNLNDFIKTPARIGHRQYTPLAEWQFREFNELYHLFQLRLKMSYPAAEHYVEQFPKEKTVQVARFVSFVAGSLLGLLAIGSMLDYELIAGFEITPGLNALSCIGILTTIVAISRGMLPDDYTIYDPEWSIRNVIQHTHYMPESWNNKLHSDDVKRDFMTLYDLKISIFVQELLSVIFTPFVLWFSLPKCSDKIIDFFREFTVHVDGVGYVCSFAVFNFQKPGQQQVNDVRDDYFSTKDNKMLSSYLGFMDNYHNGQPGRGPNWRRGVNPQIHNMVQSPILTAEMAGPGGGRWPHDRRFSTQYGGTNLTQSVQRESPSRSHAPLATSTLLDHHHQPHPGALNRNARATGFPTTFSGNSLKEEDEDASPGQDTAQRYRSNLGESFMSTRLDEASGIPDDDRVGNEDPGVLDLLNQFVGGGNAVEGTGRAGVI